MVSEPGRLDAGGLPARTERLQERLLAAGVRSDAEPMDAWRALHSREGRRATVIDLYAIVATRRGLHPLDLPAEERFALARSAMRVVWPGFDVTGGSARTGDVLEVVDYDPAWPAAYESWRQRIAGALGATAIGIEHVGSTSVPGLAAKPTIDIQVSVGALSDEEAYVPQLAVIGLQLRSRDDFHRYFRPFAGQPRSTHVHVSEAGSDWDREHLLFRDYLRSNPSARDAYASTKRQAARTWSDDRWAYTDAKSEVILDILEAAELWQGPA